ncbi:MAG: hypothetical protein QXH71_02085 [Candidatus Anstonellaceae archaeon]
MENQEEYREYIWEKLEGKKIKKIDLGEVKAAAKFVFKDESDNYKQKLVYKLLQSLKSNNQKEFFYILIRAINKPGEFQRLIQTLEKYYDAMPKEVFINFGYSLIIGIISTYGGEENE